VTIALTGTGWHAAGGGWTLRSRSCQERLTARKFPSKVEVVRALGEARRLRFSTHFWWSKLRYVAGSPVCRCLALFTKGLEFHVARSVSSFPESAQITSRKSIMIRETRC